MSPFLTFELLVSDSGEVVRLRHPGQGAWQQGGGDGQVQVRSPEDSERPRVNQREDVAFNAA